MCAEETAVRSGDKEAFQETLGSGCLQSSRHGVGGPVPSTARQPWDQSCSLQEWRLQSGPGPTLPLGARPLPGPVAGAHTGAHPTGSGVICSLDARLSGSRLPEFLLAEAVL